MNSITDSNSNDKNTILLYSEYYVNVIKEFTCPICLGLFKNAVVMECCHNRFCKICISTYLYQVGLKPGQKRHCPMCKHETTHRKYKQDTSINNLLSFLKSRGHSAAIVDDDGSLEANGLKTPKQQYTRRSRLLHLPSQGANGGSRKIARTSSNIMHSSTTDGQATQTLHSKTQFIVFAVRSFSKNILSSEFVSFKLRDTMSASEFLKYLTWTHGLQSTSETIDCCSAHDSDIQIFIPDSSSTSYWKLINEATFGQLACWCRENRLERKVVVGHAKMDTFGTT